MNTPYFCFVSLPKIFCFASFRFWFFRFASKQNGINVFSLCFTSKRKEINIFFASLGINLTNWRTDLNIFLCFFTDCPRISLNPFSLWSFHFFFASFHFDTLFSHQSENNFASVSLEVKMTAVSLLFRFVFALFHFRFTSDFYASHRCETSEKITFFRIEVKKVSLPFRFISTSASGLPNFFKQRTSAKRKPYF